MKYHDHTEILPLLEGAGESWAHVNDGDTRDQLRATLAFGFAEINGASALLQWLVRGHGEGRLRPAERSRPRHRRRRATPDRAELLARSEGGGHAIQ